MEKEPFELKIRYTIDSEKALADKVKKIVSQNGGTLKEELAQDEFMAMTFIFDVESERDFASEIVNLVISNEYPPEVETPEVQLDTRSFPDGIYHHFSYIDERSAKKFASALRSVLMTHVPEEMYDISIVRVEENSKEEFLVIFGFPFETVLILPEDLEDLLLSIEEQENSNFSFPEIKKNKDELN